MISLAKEYEYKIYHNIINMVRDIKVLHIRLRNKDDGKCMYLAQKLQASFSDYVGDENLYLEVCSMIANNLINTEAAIDFSSINSNEGTIICSIAFCIDNEYYVRFVNLQDAQAKVDEIRDYYKLSGTDMRVRMIGVFNDFTNDLALQIDFHPSTTAFMDTYAFSEEELINNSESIECTATVDDPARIIKDMTPPPVEESVMPEEDPMVDAMNDSDRIGTIMDEAFGIIDGEAREIEDTVEEEIHVEDNVSVSDEESVVEEKTEDGE